MPTTNDIARTPLFIVRCIEFILGVVSFVLVTKYFADVEAEITDTLPTTAGDLRIMFTRGHLVTVATLAYPFITLSTLIAHLTSPGQDVFKHIQPMLLAFGGAVTNLLSGVFILNHPEDNPFASMGVYDSGWYYSTGILCIVTSLFYLFDTCLCERHRRHRT